MLSNSQTLFKSAYLRDKNAKRGLNRGVYASNFLEQYHSLKDQTQQLPSETKITGCMQC